MKIISILIIIMCPLLTWSQLSIERSTISSAGMSSSQGLQIDATLGETIIGENTSNQLIVTSGFQQTEKLTTSIKDFGVPDISIYPNPTIGPLSVKVSDELNSMRIIDLSGQVVYERVDELGLSKAHDLSQLPSGTYIVHLTMDTINWQGKLIKIDDEQF